jgi:hypothetical protein
VKSKTFLKELKLLDTPKPSLKENPPKSEKLMLPITEVLPIFWINRSIE